MSYNCCMKKLLFVFTFISFAAGLFAQEALKSTEEEYYDFLSLQGLVERPTLGYRTLSDSVWNLSEDTDHIWSSNNLGTTNTIWEASSPSENWFTKGLYQGFKYKIFGPEWFNSYNTAAPYGQNDGALWQGRGYNTSLTAGARLEGYGFELTFKPQVSWMENREFELVDNSAYYSNKFAYIWGYGNNIGADAPQRFGDESFWNYDWGDSEVRWSWNTFTLGFGTQSIWLGPAWNNPLLQSNNAASYPKFDFGIRKTSLIIPHFNLNIGDIETRIWLGKLSESDYFDDNPANDHNQITGLTISYAPSFIPGLSIGINKVCLSKWDDNESYKYLNPFYGLQGAAYGNKDEDQKVSIILDWLIPKGGVDVYSEFGIDDHINHTDSIDSYATHYWHTFTYTFGLRKELLISQKYNMRGEFIFEWNNTEMSQDFQMQWPYSFGFHSVIEQGYTNNGQWLGSGIGYGGQDQYLAFRLYYPKGETILYINRYNPDNNFLFKEAIYDVSTGESGSLHTRTWNYYKAVLAFGLQSNYFITDSFNLSGGFIYARMINPLYNQTDKIYLPWNNFRFELALKYFF